MLLWIGRCGYRNSYQYHPWCEQLLDALLYNQLKPITLVT